MRVRVKAEQVRAYWLTAMGQRVEEWVPPGEYDRGAAAEVDGVRVVALVGRNGWAWHVPERVADQLPAVVTG